MSSITHVVGLHAVTSLLEHEPTRIIKIYVLDSRHDKKIELIVQKANQLGILIEKQSGQALERLAQGTEHHQGVIAVCKKLPTLTESDLGPMLEKTKMPFILILDGVQDPHNLGACFRSADAAGVDIIIAPKDKAVGITPVVSKVASGAVETIPFVQVTNLARTMEFLKDKGIWLYGAAAEAKDTLYDIKLTGPLALVLGAEGTGLRRLTREHCDVLIKIPMVGSVSSLNVSVAAGILMFEVVRQRCLSS